MGVGRNLAYSKELFLSNRGFNKHQGIIGGDDDLFVNSLGKGKNTSVRVNPQTIVWSVAKKTLGEYFTQKIRHLSVGKKYRFFDRFKLGIYIFGRFLMYLMMLFLIITNTISDVYIIFIIFAFEQVILFIALVGARKRAGDSYTPWLLPLNDLIYLLIYIFTGLKALLTKKVKWN